MTQFDPSHEINSRERLLQTLKDKTSFLPEEIAQQLQSRDELIESLNSELIELRSKISSEPLEWDRPVRALNNLVNEKADLQELLNSTEKKYREDREKWQSENQSLKTCHQELLHENTKLTSTLEFKEKEIGELKHDMELLSDIIQQLTVLNKEMNTKIEEHTETIQDLNAKYFEELAKGDTLEALEQSLEDVVKYSQEVEAKTVELNDLLSKVSETVQTAVSGLENCIQKAENGTDFLDSLKKIKHSLSIKLEPDSSHEAYIFSLQEQLRARDRENKTLRHKVTPLQQQIKSLKGRIEKEIESHQATSKSMIDNLQTINDRSCKLRDQLETNRNTLYEKNVELKTCYLQISNLASKAKSFEKRVKELDKENRSLKNALQTAKFTNTKIEKDEIGSKNVAQKLKVRINKLENTLMVMKDEIRNKDTQIIKLKKEILAQPREETKLNFDENPNTLNKVIQDQEQQIILLKDMLKRKKR